VIRSIEGKAIAIAMIEIQGTTTALKSEEHIVD